MRKKNVAILFGGQSDEHEVSLQSSINIVQSINREKYNIILIGIDKKGRWILCEEHSYLINIDDPSKISLIPSHHYLAIVPGHNFTKFIYANTGQYLPFIDVVFSLLHGSRGEDGSVQGLLQILNIPYVGSDVLGSAVCMDKDITKRLLRDSGISVTPWVTLFSKKINQLNFNDIVKILGLPLFIKPTNQGSSIGSNKIFDQNNFEQALELAFSYNTKVLVEKFIEGREIEIAIFGDVDPEVSVCGEIITNSMFYTYQTKYLKPNKSKIITPAQLEQSLSEKIRRIAREVYLTLGCKIMARVDFFITHDNKILLNEVNTLPGFTSNSMYPKLWKASSLNLSDLIDRLISFAISHD